MNTQELILKGLIENDAFSRKTIPYIKVEYFEGPERIVFQMILQYVVAYSKLPSVDVLKIEYESSDVDDTNVVNVISNMSEETEKMEEQWILDKTEKWCKDRAMYLAIMESIQIIDGKHKEKSEGSIPDIMTAALAINFDENVGHDYTADAEDRFEFYHRTEERVPFDLDMMNQITKGGAPRKTLNIIMSGTGGGKSLMMCHMASAALAQGRNVLYITCEMAEERIAERIDANLFDIPLDDLVNVSKEVFTSKINRIKAASTGKLIVKEYPTGIAHVGHFRALLNDLKLKKGFMPDIIYVDYLNICASSRMKGLGGAINSYSLVKAIAEEVRGLAVEFNVPIWSATQTNRDGFDNSDADLTNVAESFGLPATADFMIVIINTEELAANNRIMIKQLKNRYRDVNVDKRFLLGSDRPYMRLYDVDNATDGLMQDTPSPSAATGASKSASKKMDTSDFKM